MKPYRFKNAPLLKAFSKRNGRSLNISSLALPILSLELVISENKQNQVKYRELTPYDGFLAGAIPKDYFLNISGPQDHLWKMPEQTSFLRRSYWYV